MLQVMADVDGSGSEGEDDADLEAALQHAEDGEPEAQPVRSRASKRASACQPGGSEPELPAIASRPQSALLPPSILI